MLLLFAIVNAGAVFKPPLFAFENFIIFSESNNEKHSFAHLNCINSIEINHNNERIYIDMPLTKRFKRRSVNIDDRNFHRAQALAQDMGLSLSATFRVLIARAFADYE